MPIITDDELSNYQIQAKEAKKHEHLVNYTQIKLQHEQESVKKFKTASVILGIIALLGIAGTAYFMFFNPNTGAGVIAKKDHKAKQEVLKDRISNLEDSIKDISTNQQLASTNSQTSGKLSLKDELIYAVQIGAYKDKDLSMYSDEFVNFKEIKVGEFNRYSIGNFASLDEAQKFRKEMIKLGFRNAFIASYQYGERVKIEEAW